MKRIFLLLLAAALWQACDVNGIDYDKNEDINAELRGRMHEKADALMQALYENDAQAVKGMMSPGMKTEKMAVMDTVIPIISGALRSAQYEVIDEFSVQNSYKEEVTIIPGELRDAEYRIRYKAENEQGYGLLLLPEGDQDKLLVTVIYGKYEDTWRINILRVGEFALDGMIAPQLYEQAGEYYDKGHLANAGIAVSLMSRCMYPAEDFLIYEKEEQMQELHDEVISKVTAAYDLPLVVEALESQPLVISIYMQSFKEGFFPQISYVTNIDFADSTALEAENIRMHEMLGELFTGMDENTDYVVYSVYEEMPGPQDSVQTYGFVREN